MKIDLTELREQIDEIDSQILSLFEKRMAISEQVAAYKMTAGLPVLDRSREAEKLHSIKALVHNESNSQGAGELFTLIMELSRKRQHQLLEEQENLAVPPPGNSN